LKGVLANLRETLQSFECGTDHQPIGNIVTMKMLNNEEESVLRDSIDTPRVTGAFNGTGVCQLETACSIPSGLLTFPVNDETHTAFWSPCLTRIVLEDLNYMNNLIRSTTISNQTQALSVTSAK